MISKADIRRTARAVAAVQLPDGAIPWGVGRHVDPWNHVEAAMGLDVAGEHAAARRAYRWLAQTQRADGAWPAAILDGQVFDPTLDANMCAYIAAGVWHHHLYMDDLGFLEEMWPVVRRAVGFVLDLQAPEGEIYWARDASGRPWPGALLTSSACIYLSLRCAHAIANTLDEARPDLELSIDALRAAVIDREARFEPKKRYSMDWYYPVLGGAVAGSRATARLEAGRERFVVPGHGCLCVGDRPWVTTGETCELALAYWAAGEEEEARSLFEWTQRMRAPDGLYWTGVNLPDGVFWPDERAPWSAGAMLLAWETLHSDGPSRGLFAGSSLTYEPASGSMSEARV